MTVAQSTPLLEHTDLAAELAPAVPTGEISGWGGQSAPGREVRDERLTRIGAHARLSRGLGRSYGDSSLPADPRHVVVNTTAADRILHFEESTGIFRAEAGFSLATLVDLYLPRGWFTPVTPGTKFVTLGGMVASDVHGKNHHAVGTIGKHVTALRLQVADGSIVDCSRDQHPDLFFATLGGMGLTGHILEVELRLSRIPSPWIYQETEKVPNIDVFLSRLADAEHDWPMTVGWIDCLSRGNKMGRGILHKGRWAEPDEAPDYAPKSKLKLTVPFYAPSWLLGRVFTKCFNFAFYHKHFGRERRGIVSPDSFFYPLDVIHHWNRGYGKRGFTQYQCVLPKSAGIDAPRRFLELLTKRGGASFLCVIKDCGPEGEGMLSFPMPGTSVALDIPMRNNTQSLIDALNEFVIAEGGRIYLTKDGYTRGEHYRAMDPRIERFQSVRRKWDPEGRFTSAQARRIFGDAE